MATRATLAPLPARYERAHGVAASLLDRVEQGLYRAAAAAPTEAGADTAYAAAYRLAEALAVLEGGEAAAYYAAACEIVDEARA